MNHLQAQKLVTELYQAVDNKDIEYLERSLDKKIRFRIGNGPAATNKGIILEANRQFFNSIQSMRHSIEDIMSQTLIEGRRAVDKITCFGHVDYVRSDGTEHSAVFSTFLQVENEMITDYLVFADLSGL